MKRRALAGWALTGSGALLVLWAVIAFDAAALGGRVREFSDRRPYNEVKRSAHGALPGLLVRAGAGGALIWVGARVLRGARRG